MVPSAYVELATFPLTPNGKLDRRALPAPTWQPVAGAVAPRTPTEELLAALWAQVLHLPQVGVHDNFFALGGHSLLATQVVSRVRDTFAIELPLRELFETPTVAELAASLDRLLQTSEGRESIPPIRPAPPETTLPLSFAQQRIWFLDRLSPGDSFYNSSLTLRLQGELNLAALEASLTALVARHASLRTTFSDVDGHAVQIIAPPRAVSPSQINLRDLPAAERERRLAAFSTAEAQRPFDLTRGPLLRVNLVTMATDEYALLFTLHHIVTDGWSIGIIINELVALYRAHCLAQPAALPPLPLQYADFAYWQRQWLQGETLTSLLRYWTDKLAGSDFVLDLPTDFPRPAVQQFHAAAAPFQISQEITAALTRLSRQEGTTLFMTLLAAFQTLLHRYSGQDTILVGTPIANRTQSALEHIVGCFVNTLVLRADFAEQPTFRALLQQVRQTTLDAYAHQALPFEKLVDAIQPTRDLSHAPLFQVMFVLQNTPQATLDAPGMTIVAQGADVRTADFDLTFNLQETADGIAGTVEYNTDLFKPATITRLITHFQLLLERLLAAPEQSVANTPLLTVHEERQLLEEWNATPRTYPVQPCVHELFEAQVARTPNAVAIRDGADQLTYSEVNQQANQLAHYLRQRGVTAETPVLIYLERSWAAVVAMLGVLKAGGVMVPLTPPYPAERLAFVITDTSAPFIITHTALHADLPTTAAQIIEVDRAATAIAAAPLTDPHEPVNAAQMAYIIYTSGSTGTPKGVMVAHDALATHVQVSIEQHHLTPADRVLQFYTFQFDAALEQIFPTLLSGAVLVLAPSTPTVEELSALICQQKITVLDLPTAYWRMAVEAWRAAPSLLTNQALRLVLVGGEAMPAAALAVWQGTPLRQIPLLNAYGPTEAVVTATLYAIPPNYATKGNIIPIGQAVAPRRLYILDAHAQLVPVGVPGELYIGGTVLARGYLNRPDLTAEKFIPDPFSRVAGARLYRTGDLVRYQPDGTIEFLGRTDHQIKIRGYRIELGEIEAVLNQHVAVKEALVVVHAPNTQATGAEELRLPHRGQRLVAYLIGETAAVPPAQELRTFLQQQLPDYMIPNVFVVLDAFPINATGKVDRNALPRPDDTDPEREADFVAPATPVEEQLAAIWAQVLGIAQVGIHDNFFELGGDSILSIQIIARANAAGLRITPQQLFQQQTVAELAAVVGTTAAVHAEQELLTGPVPLTPIQQWFFAEAFAEAHYWNQSILLVTHKLLDPALLRVAVTQLCDHHDALRLRFRQSATGWTQRYDAPTEQALFEQVDLSTVPVNEQRTAIEAKAAAVQMSLDLTHGPLLRVVQMNLGSAQPGRLLLVAHHLVIDGVSWRILLEDLQAIYEQLHANQPVQLPPKSTSYRYWAERLVEYAQSPELQQELTYWLDSAPRTVAPMPMDYPDRVADNTEASIGIVDLSLSAEETHALLHEAPAAYHTQIQDILLTALVQAYDAWAGTPTLLVDLEGHGREDLFPDTDLTRTVGWFTTVYPVLLELPQTAGTGQALQQIKEILRRIPQSGIGYGLLRYLGDQTIAHQVQQLPSAAISFNYLGQLDQILSPASGLAPAAETPGAEHSPCAKRSYLLEITASVTRGQLRLLWVYSKAVHAPATIEQFAQHYHTALQTLIVHCQSPESGGFTPSDFPLAALDQEEIDIAFAEVEFM
jgi:amino acid adenylation domain-containing protein/non-ribosomal peptide synthase protein (TIGR01720 family)